MKELAEIHNINPNYNLRIFLMELRRVLNLKVTELHRIKIVATSFDEQDQTQKIFHVLFNDESLYGALKRIGKYVGQWQWEISFGSSTALVLTPPRGNSGFITNSLHHDEPRKEVAIKNRNGLSLFDVLDEIRRQLPHTINNINTASLTNEVIFLQFNETQNATYFLTHFKCDAISFAHSRGRIIKVENYPIKKMNKASTIFNRLFPPLK